MGKGKYVPKAIDRARDELFSHIRRCGVLEAEDEQRDEWFDDTIEYIRERYPELTPGELDDLRTIGQRYCAPVVPHGKKNAQDVLAGDDSEDSDDAVDTGEVSAA